MVTGMAGRAAVMLPGVVSTCSFKALSHFFF